MKNFTCMALSAVLFLTLFFTGRATAQEGRYYDDARRMYNNYKRNQAQIDELNRSIADHEAAIRNLRRDAASASYGFGSLQAGSQYSGDIAAHRAAIEREQRQLNLLEHRQTIIETSWERNGHISGYYGSLRDTHGRTIYDPRSRKDVNLMDYRMDSFRNPGGHRNSSRDRSVGYSDRSGYSSSSRSSRRSDRSGYSSSKSNRDSSRTSYSSSRNSNVSSRNTGSSRRSSSGGSGGSHTITLTPVE